MTFCNRGISKIVLCAPTYYSESQQAEVKYLLSMGLMYLNRVALSLTDSGDQERNSITPITKR